MAHHRVQGLGHVLRRGGRDIRPVVDFDARILAAGIGLHRLQLGIQEGGVHRKLGVAFRTRGRFLQEVILEAHAGGGEGHAVQHRLDEVRVLRQDGVVLAHEGRHERGVQVHADLQTTAAEAVRDGPDSHADDMALGLEEIGRHGLHEGETVLRGVAGDGQEGVALLLPGRADRVQIDPLLLEALRANRAAAVEHAAHAAHEGLRADPVQENAVKAAVTEVFVINGDDVDGVPRVRRAVEAETLACRQVVVGRYVSPQVHGGHVVAHFLGLGEHREPEQHLDVLAVEIGPHFPVDVLVQAPADDDFPDRDQVGNRVDAADDPLRRVVRRVPASQGDLHDVPGLRRGLGLARRQGEQADE